MLRGERAKTFAHARATNDDGMQIKCDDVRAPVHRAGEKYIDLEKSDEDSQFTRRIAR